MMRQIASSVVFVFAVAAATAVTDATPVFTFVKLAGQVDTPGSTNGGVNAARFYYPTGVAASQDGAIYVADQGNHLIRRISATGIVTNFGSGAFAHPQGVAVASDGRLYVADSGNRAVKVITASGAVTTLAGLAHGLVWPTGVAVSSLGTVYVVDPFAHTLSRITTTNGVAVATVAGAADLDAPSGVAVDSAGWVYVVESGGRRVRMVSPAGVVTTLASLGGERDDGVSPMGIAVDSTRVLYVADWKNHVIYRLTRDGVLTVLAGAAGQGGYVEGLGSDARFDRPHGVAVDASDRLYVVDSGNYVIRRGTRPPDAFVRNRPNAGEADVTTAPALMWGQVRHATEYQYCIDTVNNGMCDATWQSAGRTNVAGLSGLTLATTYYWQVRAINDGGTTYANGVSSSFGSFTTTDGLARWTPIVIRNPGDTTPLAQRVFRAPPGVQPVGLVSDLVGAATVTRANGSVETVAPGTQIYRDDTVETSPSGQVGFSFRDGSVFTQSPNARLQIDEYVYDDEPAAASGYSWLRNVFVWTSGLIGGARPEEPPGYVGGIRGSADDIIRQHMLNSPDAGLYGNAGIWVETASPVGVSTVVPVTDGRLDLTVDVALVGGEESRLDILIDGSLVTSRALPVSQRGASHRVTASVSNWPSTRATLTFVHDGAAGNGVVIHRLQAGTRRISLFDNWFREGQGPAQVVVLATAAQLDQLAADAGVAPGPFGKATPATGSLGLPADVTLTWTPGPGAATFEYCLDTTNDGACSNWIDVGEVAQVRPPGLTTGREYFWQVRAKNVHGTTYADGNASTFWRFWTVQTVPGPPAITGVTPGDGTLRVAFQPGETGGWPISNYEFSVDGGATFARRTPASTASPLVVTGLTNGTQYNVRIRAINTLGAGEPSSIATGTPVRPTLSSAPLTLRFSATKAGPAGDLTAVTGVQAVVVSATGFPVAQWTAASDQPWAVVTNGSGTGVGTFSVSIANPGNVIAGSTNLTASIAIVAPNAGTSASVTVQLTVIQQSGTTTAPIGQVDTPVQASTGAQGAVAMTGWVVDDVGVQHVRIYRQCLSFDVPAACQTVLGTSVVLVGEASVIPGARPDVEGLYPTLPAANSAGWGFLILSNLLPNIPAASSSGGGVGTFTLYAVATDVEGNQKLLGRTVNDSTPTTVTVANDTIAKPFGAIDTPGQGATVSGTLNNFGWALTPDPGTGVLIPTTGSTITVFIDGVPVGTATYNLCRGSVGNPVPAGLLCDDDVSSIFRNAGSFRNLDAARGAIALRTISTSALTNGLHTISWGVTDSANRSEGIGSRYFTVLNSEVRSADVRGAEAGSRSAGASAPADRHGLKPVPYEGEAIFARTGYDLQAGYTPLEPNGDGVPQVRIPEHGRVELQMPGVVAGALIVSGEARALPVGVGIDRDRGLVTWVAGAGYLGTYRLRFEVPGSRSPEVDVTVAPATAADEPVRMHLDSAHSAPAAPHSALRTHAALRTPHFALHGWALDPQAATGSGIGAVHVWGQSRSAECGVRECGPIFLGLATLGIARPDVAAAHGAQFPNAGFVFEGVLPDDGEWEVTAYVWVTRTGRFEDARTSTVRKD